MIDLLNKEYEEEKNIKWEWDNIKKEFTNDEKLLKLFVDFRTELVNDLLFQIFSFFKNCENVCISKPSGSTGPDATLFSDYDLTITGHFQISKIIDIFNKIIYDVFRVTSNDALDTNLYGYSFLISNKSSSINNVIWTLDKFNDHYEIVHSDEIYKEQDKWAYLRLYTLVNNYNIINLDITDYNNFALKYPIELKPKIKSEQYIYRMKIFEKLTIDTTNKDSIIDALSFMNYYGEDTYFTQGAFMHVVGTMFYYNKKSIEDKRSYLKKYHIIHLLIENTAYFIYSYNSKINTPNEALIYASKYLQRFMNGLLLLFNNYILMQLLELCNNIKSNIRGKSLFELKSHIGSYDEYSDKDIDVDYFKTLKVAEIKKSLIDIISEFQLSKPDDDVNYYINAVLLLLKYTLEKYKDYTTLTITYENNKFSINKK